jgi:hypothetical protein
LARNRLSARTYAAVLAALERGDSLSEPTDSSGAVARLRELHRASARVDLGRVHASWLVRALREESPAVQRLVVAALPHPLRGELQGGLLLEGHDLESERVAGREAAGWVLALWSERLVGGEGRRGDDPAAVIAMSGLSLRAGYRLCRHIGLCKMLLAQSPRALESRGLDTAARAWLSERLAPASEDLIRRVRHDVDSKQVMRLPARLRTARIGLSTLARLLSTVEAFRLRWALQHWPYPIAKLIRSILAAGPALPPAALKGEELILKTAWDHLIIEGRLPLAWPDATSGSDSV